MAMGSLPASASGLFQEISFRRTLASCEDIVAGDCKGREDLKAWKTSPVFHHYVDTLQNQLEKLASTAGSRIEKEVLEQYRDHVTAIAQQLEKPELPAASPPPPALPAALQNGNARSPPPPLRVPTLPPLAVSSHRSAGGSDAEPPPADSDAAAAGQHLQPPRAAAAAALRPQPPGRSAGPPVNGAQARLQTQTNLQEALTEELADMAATLKSSTLAVEGRLKERGQLLESTETALDHSLTHTKRSAVEAKRIHSKGRMNFCMTILIMLIVGVVFAGTYIFIKATSFAGYNAARAQAAAAAAQGEL